MKTLSPQPAGSRLAPTVVPLSTIARIVVGLILLWAAAAKLRRREDLPDWLAAYGVPARYARPAAWAVMAAEAVVGVLLLFGVALPLARVRGGRSSASSSSRRSARRGSAASSGCAAAASAPPRGRPTTCSSAPAASPPSPLVAAFGGGLERLRLLRHGGRRRPRPPLRRRRPPDAARARALPPGRGPDAPHRPARPVRARRGRPAARPGRAAARRPPRPALPRSSSSSRPPAASAASSSPGVAALARQGLTVRVVEEEHEEDVFERWNVPGTPFVVHARRRCRRGQGNREHARGARDAPRHRSGEDPCSRLRRRPRRSTARPRSSRRSWPSRRPASRSSAG